MKIGCFPVGLSVVFVITSATVFDTSAATIDIGWASEANPGAHVLPDNPSGFLGEPDGSDFGTFGEGDGILRDVNLSLFTSLRSYDEQSFADFLDVSISTLRQADVIAFEFNGIPGDLFETSTWTFSSGAMTEITEVGFSVTGDVLAEGNILPADYNNFFGANSVGNIIWVFALFDLQTVDPRAADFSINIFAISGNDAETPDIDAVGALVTLDPLDGSDFNGDNVVDGGDFLALQRNYGITSGATKAQGDADNNGTVDAADLGIWENQYGTVATLSASAAVPEPSSLLLGALSSIGLMLRRRCLTR